MKEYKDLTKEDKSLILSLDQFCSDDYIAYQIGCSESDVRKVVKRSMAYKLLNLMQKML